MYFGRVRDTTQSHPRTDFSPGVVRAGPHVPHPAPLPPPPGASSIQLPEAPACLVDRYPVLVADGLPAVQADSIVVIHCDKNLTRDVPFSISCYLTLVLPVFSRRP